MVPFRNRQVPVQERPKTSIPVAVREIREGEQVAAADIRMQEISADSVPEGILLTNADIEGLFAKEIILPENRSVNSGWLSGEKLSLAYNLPDGYRAVSLFVNESNLLSMQIMTGDYVGHHCELDRADQGRGCHPRDIHGAAEHPGAGTRPEPRARQPNGVAQP